MTQMNNFPSNQHNNHLYIPAKKFQKKVAYFSMEFAIHQGLDTYSGGLGFLAGSHMLSAYSLKQNVVGIGMLWKYGYYSQARKDDQTMEPRAIQKYYNFLEDTGIEVGVRIHENFDVKVRAYLLRPEVFNTVPIYFLTTDLDSNDYLSRTITNYLYDANEVTRVSQSIVLGIGGAKIMEALGGADIYHLNEGHALPAFYYLRDRGITKDQMVFTTHTPEKGGNEERNAYYLNDCGFFGRNLSDEELRKEMVNGDNLNYTISALRFAKRSNAVSKLHSKVADGMWKNYENISKIIPITNAQNEVFWQDVDLKKAFVKRNQTAFQNRKRSLKQQLFQEVLKQTGKLFDPDVLTIVWARRFAGYKRADLLLHDLHRFEELVRDQNRPIQIIWAGKPYPMDFDGIGIFNRLVKYTAEKPNLAVLVGYEIDLSRKLKLGADIWLNNPRITREASGTSGMTAAMNGAVNLSTNDGWIPEFQRHGENSFVLPEIDHLLPVEQQDAIDSDNLYAILENEVIPLFYEDKEQWMNIVFKSMEDILPEFGSDRMATEYYDRLYS
ncbi:alpha-glucan family phosphorylase [Poritiphilus flavus]|uniref:Alpha-glucan family phosphorylase n=1 Tax=Poritiphilus flavus TaxID=2697053 RepID=A0A6L9E6Q0_9FLAO|nr:alpha-glucan family phosphorylase [Poritiphilus flavus]NAS10417.1 alpha-glucan family phosphorylase [Poritiphilus flavus]